MRFLTRTRRMSRSAAPGLYEDADRLRHKTLSESDLFQDLTQDQMGEISQRFPMATCTAGQLIYAPGETGEALFVLKVGHVQIYRLAPDGRKLVLDTIGPGTIFGEMTVLAQSMTGSFAAALDDCMVCIMSQVDIEQVMMAHPQVAVRLVRLLSQRLHESAERLQELAFAPLHVRLARLLLSLHRDGEISGYSHQELADMLGASRETVSRALLDLKSAGVVAVDRRCIQLLDADALARRLGDSG